MAMTITCPLLICFAALALAAPPLPLLGKAEVEREWPPASGYHLSSIGAEPSRDRKGAVPDPGAVSPGPEDVWVVANRNMPASQAVADYYCLKRKVPPDHIILLDLPDGEEMSRADYEARLLRPLREKLSPLRGKDFVLLTVYGVPIRIAAIGPSESDQRNLELLKKDMEETQTKIETTQKEIARQEAAGDSIRAASYQPALQALQQARARQELQQINWSQKESQAAVDSELALLWWEKYSLARWQLNLRYFSIPESVRQKSPPIVMTCRLDGPTPVVAKRLVDDALQAESAGGPKGNAYVDARGIKWESAGDPSAGSYGGYDESLRELAALFRAKGITTKLDDKPEVFAIGSCPDCALYCGWYALETYTPALELRPGSVAYHMASFEAVSLRQKTPKRWAPNLLQDGAAATIGPVSEPYLIAFPKPATFFGFVLSGKPLVECYWLSNHLTSWQMMLIGDPLYRPYGKAPKMRSDEVRQSPEGSSFPPRLGRN